MDALLAESVARYRLCRTLAHGVTDRNPIGGAGYVLDRVQRSCGATARPAGRRRGPAHRDPALVVPAGEVGQQQFVARGVRLVVVPEG